MHSQNGNLPHGLLRVKSMLNSLKPAEKRVATYILENPTEVIHLSITRLAEQANVSEATVVKFCQRIGYSGYQELKIYLAQSVEDKDLQPEHIYGEIKSNDDIGTILNKIFQTYNQSLNNTKKLLENSRLEECVRMIKRSRRLFFFGYGASGVVSLDAELKFKRINYTAEALLDNHNQKTVGALLDPTDLVIAISDSGRTRELIETIAIVKKTGAKIIAITSNLGSPLTEYADEVLLTSSEETTFRGSALASRMSQLAVIDLLFLGVATSEFDNTLEALKKTRTAIKPSKI